jgi:DNA polymerase-3 subunit gamma/tau
VRSLGEGSDAVARPQGNGGAAAPAPNFTPRYETPRGSPRSSAAVSPRLAEEPEIDRVQAAPTLSIGSFEQLIALVTEKRDVQTKLALQNDVRLVRCEDGQLEIALEANAPKTLVHDLQRKITGWTGKRWIVVVSKEEGAATLRAQMDAKQAEIERDVQGDPLVQAVLNRFPGAKIVGVTQNSGGDDVPDAPADDEAD